jgi:hypothetical protein
MPYMRRAAAGRSGAITISRVACPEPAGDWVPAECTEQQAFVDTAGPVDTHGADQQVRAGFHRQARPG